MSSMLTNGLIRLLVAVLLLPVATADDSPVDPATLTPLAGNWYVSQTQPAVYYFRDAGRFVDLFSWHQKDSNNDGIANVRLQHDQNFLIIESQGYPNHPTAIFPNAGNPNSIRVQNFRFRLPLKPQQSDQITTLPMGPIGMALNGVVFFSLAGLLLRASSADRRLPLPQISGLREVTLSG